MSKKPPRKRKLSKSEDDGLKEDKHKDVHPEKKNVLSMSCQYPIQYYNGYPLSGLQTIQNPIFTMPGGEIHCNEFDESLVELPIHAEDIDQNTIENKISGCSNFLTVMDACCMASDIHTLKIIQNGHTHHLFDIILEYFPEIEKIEIWSTRFLPIHANEKIILRKGYPEKQDGKGILLISLSDSALTRDEMEYQNYCYHMFQPEYFSLFFTPQIQGACRLQCMANHARIISSTEITEISQEDVDKMIRYYEFNIRLLWPWSVFQFQNLDFDIAYAYHILGKYFARSDQEISDHAFNESLKDIQERIANKIYKPRLNI